MQQALTRTSALLALADDLTGALEIGAKFAARGLRAQVVTDLSASGSPSTDLPPSDLLVLDTETRHSHPHTASDAIHQALTHAAHPALQLVFKKTDSTLRGNIVAELRALEQHYPGRPLLYAPAYPDLGRTVKDRSLFVHGIPVHQTGFAVDRWNPVTDCHIPTLLGDLQTEILDGECNADIENAAAMILRQPAPRLCAGCGALAEALARQLQPSTPAARPLPRVRRCLVVNGSLHPASAHQIETAARAGVFGDGWKLLPPVSEGEGAERARSTGEAVRELLRTEPFEALLVFGGDTAFGIHSALGSPPFEALGEVAPGVPLSRTKRHLWITKAGGFGPPDLLATIRRRLS